MKGAGFNPTSFIPNAEARRNTERRIKSLRAQARSLNEQADRLQRILDRKEKP